MAKAQLPLEAQMKVGGRDFNLTKQEVEARMKGEEPELIQKHMVEVNGQTHALLTPLTEVQRRLLELWGLPPDLYDRLIASWPTPPTNASGP